MATQTSSSSRVELAESSAQPPRGSGCSLRRAAGDPCRGDLGAPGGRVPSEALNMWLERLRAEPFIVLDSNSL